MSINQVFFQNNEIETEKINPKVERKIMCYDTDLMLVKVLFEKGGIGEPHKHPHQQASYVAKGKFEVEIDQKKKILKAGDSFLVPENKIHGVKCLSKGILIDTFSPKREAFLE